MKPDKPTLNLKESELLDEVHRTEKEIDLFLKDQAREAEAILENARAAAEKEQELIAREAEGLFHGTYRQLVEAAEHQAGTILEEGAQLAAEERNQLEEHRDVVVNKILELLLEKKA